MNNTLMVLGAGRGQLQLISSAKRAGYEVVAVSLLKGYLPGAQFADRIEDTDYSDSEAVLEIASRIKPGGIATSCADTPLISLGKTCDALGLPGLSERSARLCADKRLMKEAFAAHKVNTPRFRIVHSIEELSEILAEIGYPALVKAVDSQGSKGVSVVGSLEEALMAFRIAIDASKQDYVLVEEFIDGYEFGAQALVVRGEIVAILPHDDEVARTETGQAPVGHSFPMDAPASLISKAQQEVTKAIKALEMDNCAVNVDMIERDGEVFMIELTGRVGANGLGEITSLHLGLDYYGVVADLAMGVDVRPRMIRALESQRRAVLSRMLFSRDKSGVISSIEYSGTLPEQVDELVFFKRVGDSLDVFNSSSDVYGQLVVTGTTLEECESIADAVSANILLEVE